ncbi:MAG TPA: PrsW family glutamic-type intramembrane protease [Elainellaceae cyanobacterium]
MTEPYHQTTALLWRLLPGSRKRSEYHHLSSDREFTVGRDPRCDVTFDYLIHSEVSRQHLKICSLPNAFGLWQVCDLNSSNGTYVNGDRVQDCRILNHGDIISLGRRGPQFIFELQFYQPFQQDPSHFLDSPDLTTKASTSHAISQSGSRPSSPFSATDPATLTQLFPIISTGRELAQKAHLIPVIITISFVVLMFAAVGQTEWFNFLLAAYISGAAYYFVYRLCNKQKPWWLIAASATMTALLLTSPILQGFLWFFRGVLPGQPQSDSASINLISLVFQMFIGAGLMEELIKAIPVLLAYGIGMTVKSSRYQAQIGIREPLDGILLGTASAMGFTLVETLGQYIPAMVNSVAAGGETGDLMGLQLLIPRILGSVSGHMAYSGYFGYFIGLSAFKPRQRWKILGIGYLSSSVLHALWNVMGFINPLVLALVGVLSYAFLGAAILKARTLSSHESQQGNSHSTKMP